MAWDKNSWDTRDLRPAPSVSSSVSGGYPVGETSSCCCNRVLACDKRIIATARYDALCEEVSILIKASTMSGTRLTEAPR